MLTYCRCFLHGRRHRVCARQGREDFGRFRKVNIVVEGVYRYLFEAALREDERGF